MVDAIDINIMLRSLGYSAQRMELNLLSLNELREQFIRLSSSDDKNTEHYRYRHFLNKIDELLSTNADLNDLLNLLSRETDRLMAWATLKKLLYKTEDYPEQFELIKSHPIFKLLEFDNKVYNRKTYDDIDTYLSALECVDPGRQKINDILKKCFGRSQQRLIELGKFSETALELLSQKGATAKVRNISKHLLRQKKRQTELPKNRPGESAGASEELG